MSNILWFITVFISVAVVLFILGIWMTKISQRREVDSNYHAKWTAIEKKWDPVYNFFFNLSMWIFGILVIYFVYLG